MSVIIIIVKEHDQYDVICCHSNFSYCFCQAVHWQIMSVSRPNIGRVYRLNSNLDNSIRRYRFPTLLRYWRSKDEDDCDLNPDDGVMEFSQDESEDENFKCCGRLTFNLNQ